MCGICGVINKKSTNIDKDALLRMVHILAHRGPDGEGIFIDRNVGLGHRRLAVIDLTQNATQPMSNEDGRIWVVFNGMIYNYRDLRKDLLAKGHQFKSHTDTEVIIHLYEEMGVDCVNLLRGMFAFAIWDSVKRELVLARDRIGQKPLAYAENEDFFVFASETKAIFASNIIDKNIDMNGVHHCFSYMNAPWPYTMYKDVKQLPPASVLMLDLKNMSFRINNYWRLEFSKENKITPDDAVTGLTSILEETVKLLLISDVPSGALLSGGLDSSTVVAIASRFSGKPVETFSVGFQTSQIKDPEFNFSREVSLKFGTHHHEIPVGSDIINILPEVLWHYDEPYANPIALPNFLLCRLMKKKVTVALSGDGGDEVFAGYPGYRIWKAIGLLNRVFPFVSNSRKTDVLSGPVNNGVLRTIFALPENKRSIRKDIFSHWFYDNLYAPEAKKQIREVSTGKILEDFYLTNNSKDLLDGILFMDLVLYNSHGVSLISDISGMASGLEIRSPFLDHKLVEFAFSLPVSSKIRGFSQTKYILRQAMNGVLPKQILARKKVSYGEGIPFKSWFLNEWHDTVKQFLFDGGLRKSGFFDMSNIEKVFADHLNLKRDNFSLLWSLVCFSVWFDHVFTKSEI